MASFRNVSRQSPRELSSFKTASKSRETKEYMCADSLLTFESRAVLATVIVNVSIGIAVDHFGIRISFIDSLPHEAGFFLRGPEQYHVCGSKPDAPLFAWQYVQ